MKEINQLDISERRPGLDANRYATKKTIAQGMLDVALLTANASQLKYVLQLGDSHPFYELMISLIVISIILQVIVAVLSLSLNLTRDCKLYDDSQKNWAEGINWFSLGCVFVISFLNVLLVGLDPYAVL